jgi:hypothetical protein
MPRTLSTELVRLPNGKITQLTIRVDGWRIDFKASDMEGRHTNSMVHVANEALDGTSCGWCACAYNSQTPDAHTQDLVLNGSETA